MSRQKVEACWKIDIKDMRASLKALIPQQPSGRVWREWGDFTVECLEPGEVWVRVWMDVLPFLHRAAPGALDRALSGRASLVVCLSLLPASMSGGLFTHVWN